MGIISTIRYKRSTLNKTGIQQIIKRMRNGLAHGAKVFLHLKMRTRLILLIAVVVIAAGVILAVQLTADGEPQQASAAVVPTALAPTPTPEPVPTTAPLPSVKLTLEPGDENAFVRELQDRLMALGYLDVDDTTQLYGEATEYAIKLFQRQYGLEMDGVAGEETITLIYANDAKSYTLLEGTEGTDVDSLQRQLVAMGYLSHATGYYGTETVSAVKDFQKRNDLTVDGKTGPQTIDLIYSPDAKMSATKESYARHRANILTVLSTAEAQLGKPYVLGNEGPNSFDCSGLVYYCLRQAGSSRGRYNAAGYSKVSGWDKITSMNDLEKGDLLFFWNSAKSKVGHVGIYVGSGTMIDASSSNGKVVRRSCKTSYWQRMFVYARRPW